MNVGAQLNLSQLLIFAVLEERTITKLHVVLFLGGCLETGWPLSVALTCCLRRSSNP